ncbi:MAG: long-chain-fatty-acid--CoA ligase [Chloroflexi bacterium]|nr:long-chain-fatty-acid--CoA ligase [Chloroflexota bacterium]
MNVSEFLDLTVEIVPDRSATVFEGRRRTFEELHDHVNRLANTLASLGVTQGDRVAILDVNTDDYIAVFFASAKLDAIFVPLNFRAKADEIAFMLNDSEAKVLLVGPVYDDLVASLQPVLTTVRHVMSLGGSIGRWSSLLEQLPSASAERFTPVADDSDIAILLFTAGTTGTPKGVMLPHETFSSFLLTNVEPANPDIEERTVLSVPLYHVAGIQAMMASVYSGRTLVIQRQFEPAQWLELVERERVTRATLVPTMLKMLLEHPDFVRRDLGSLETITYGAAPMTLEVIKRAITALPGVRFINAFGQTETGATIAMLPPEDHDLSGAPDEVEKKLRRLSSIGKPLPDVEVSIVDETGLFVPTGEIGEIVARGSRVMKGYWKQEEATIQTMHGGWLYTGDLGYTDEDGYIYLSGRARDFIKRGGEMISPGEVEQVLHAHPAVEEAAVIGAPDAHWGECVMAVVVLKPHVIITESDITEHCRQKLASFKKPETVRFVDSLPRNALGKVLKRTLREQFT